MSLSMSFSFFVCLSLFMQATTCVTTRAFFFFSFLSAGKGASIQVSGADDMGQDLPQQIHRVLAAYGTSSGGLPLHS